MIVNLIINRNANKPSSLHGKKVGIIGYGNIGSRVKYLMDVFDVECVLNDPPLFDQTKNQSFVDIEEVLQSDIITLHIPLTKNGKYPTHNLVNDEFLKKLKSNVILINTSRGEVIDEQALISFKKRNPESKLILDVWHNEPNINPDLLQQVFIGTPHVAGYSYDAKIKATEILFYSLQKFYNTNFDCPIRAREGITPFVPNVSDLDYQIESIVSQYWNILGDNISFLEYKISTSHLNVAYYEPNTNILAKWSYGKYLAGDTGYTLDLSRRMPSGWQAGFFFTRTNVSAEDFGEGSFDKGFYFNIPFNVFSKGYSKNTNGFQLKTMTRDGGQKLELRNKLIDSFYGSSYSELNENWNNFLD